MPPSKSNNNNDNNNNNNNSSSIWQPLSAYATGLKEPGMSPTNADYGLDSILLGRIGGPSPLQVDRALLAGINNTDYFLGFLGVGPIVGNFTGHQIRPLINQLVQELSAIPSHSFGYTAGASYRSGTPASLTLGGYDRGRINEHNHAALSATPPDLPFRMRAASLEPLVRLQSIVAHPPPASATGANSTWSPSGSNGTDNGNDAAPDGAVQLTHWAAGSPPPIAVVDTTTPFLWLPPPVCDAVVATLGLVYNATVGLYTYASRQQYADYLGGQGAALTFWLSSVEVGSPVSTSAVLVSLTLSSAAFALNASYPFRASMAYGDAPIPYFPMQCLNNASGAARPNRVILGRAFMQEVYMIVDYEAGHFGLFPAAFPSNPAAAVHLVDIPRAPDSSFPGLGSALDSDDSGHGSGLSPAATACIVVAAFVAGSLAALALWLYCRRRSQDKKKKLLLQRQREQDQKRQQELQKRQADAAADGTLSSMGDHHGDGAGKDGCGASLSDGSESEIPYTDAPTSKSNPMDRIVSFITRGRRRRWSSKRSAATDTTAVASEADMEKAGAGAIEVVGSSKYPVEVGADAQHARYELPVPLPPVELAGGGGGGGSRGPCGAPGGDSDKVGHLDHHDLDHPDDAPPFLDYEDATAIVATDADGQQPLTAYELARRRMQRQLRGPVPAYTPRADGIDHNSDEKGGVPVLAPSVSTLTSSITSSSGTTAVGSAAATVSAASPTSGSSLATMLPSPMTPSSADWPGSSQGSQGNRDSRDSSGNHTFDLPSPMTMTAATAAPFAQLFFRNGGDTAVAVSSSSSNLQLAPTSAPSAPTSAPTRMIIDPMRVICLGPLPEAVQGHMPIVVPLPSPASGRSPLSPISPQPPASPLSPLSPAPPVSPGAVTTATGTAAATVLSDDSTLGTNYTLEEAARWDSQQVAQPAESAAKAKPDDNGDSQPGGHGSNTPPRIDAGFELVHVPQLAERRYSWEGQTAEGEADNIAEEGRQRRT